MQSTLKLDFVVQKSFFFNRSYGCYQIINHQYLAEQISSDPRRCDASLITAVFLILKTTSKIRRGVFWRQWFAVVLWTDRQGGSGDGEDEALMVGLEKDGCSHTPTL